MEESSREVLISVISCSYCGNGDESTFFVTENEQVQCKTCGSRYDRLYVAEFFATQTGGGSGPEINSVNDDLEAPSRNNEPGSRTLIVCSNCNITFLALIDDGDIVCGMCGDVQNMPESLYVQETVDELQLTKCFSQLSVSEYDPACLQTTSTLFHDLNDKPKSRAKPFCECGNDVPDAVYSDDEGIKCGVCDKIQYGSEAFPDEHLQGTAKEVPQQHQSFSEVSVSDYLGCSSRGDDHGYCKFLHEAKRLHLLSYDKKARTKQLMCPAFADGCLYVEEKIGTDLYSPGESDRIKIGANDLHKLQPGDHVCFYRRALDYWHHSMVVDVDLETKIMWVVHYSTNNDDDGIVTSLKCAVVSRSQEKQASVCFHWCTVSDRDLLYRVNYPPNDCFPPSVSLHRAGERLGERKYNVLTNNCEHFVRHCKQEVHASHQVNDMVDGVVTTWRRTITSGWLKNCLIEFAKFLSSKNPEAFLKEFSLPVSWVFTGADVRRLAEDIWSKWELMHQGCMPVEEFINYVAKKLGEAIFVLFPAVSLAAMTLLFPVLPFAPAIKLVLTGLMRRLGPFVGPVLTKFLVTLVFIGLEKTGVALKG